MKTWPALVLVMACSAPRWDQEEVAVELVLDDAPEGASAVVERAVGTYAEALTVHGVRVVLRSPGDITIWFQQGIARAREGAVGGTFVSWDPFTGAIGVAEIELRADLAWNTDETCTRGTDLEAALVHELGHAFGLQHSEEPEAAMYPTIFGCDVLRRRLSRDDLDALASLYAP
jgi:predicted Zn-dependent protease